MIDLTPLDVRKKREDFRRILRGYDPEEVDAFLQLVAERLEELVKDNLTLGERSDRLREQVSAQQGREKAVQEALVTAQELRDEIKTQAHREAEEIRSNAQRELELAQKEAEELRATAEREMTLAVKEGEEARAAAHRDGDHIRKEAQADAERIIAGGRRIYEERVDGIMELERKRVRFLKSLRSMLERELDGVEIEEARPPLEDLIPDIDFDEVPDLPARAEGVAVDEGEPGRVEQAIEPVDATDMDADRSAEEWNENAVAEAEPSYGSDSEKAVEADSPGDAGMVAAFEVPEDDGPSSPPEPEGGQAATEEPSGYVDLSIASLEEEIEAEENAEEPEKSEPAPGEPIVNVDDFAPTKATASDGERRLVALRESKAAEIQEVIAKIEQGAPSVEDTGDQPVGDPVEIDAPAIEEADEQVPVEARAPDPTTAGQDEVVVAASDEEDEDGATVEAVEAPETEKIHAEAAAQPDVEDEADVEAAADETDEAPSEGKKKIERTIHEAAPLPTLEDAESVEAGEADQAGDDEIDLESDPKLWLSTLVERELAKENDEGKWS